MTVRHRQGLAVVVVTLGLATLVGPATRAVQSALMTRRAVATFAALVAAANAGDLATVHRLCAPAYLQAHPPTPAPEGGVVGLPRTIHPNFQVWRAGQEVWLCPANRVGIVYRFQNSATASQFAGPVGLLRADGTVEQFASSPD